VTTRRSAIILPLIVFMSSLFVDSTAIPPELTPNKRSYELLAKETLSNLQNHILNKWFPRATDANRGGFHQDFSEDWSLRPGTERSVVYQSRLTWVSAMAARQVPDRRSQYLELSRHGMHFLKESLWDAKNGGFFFHRLTSGGGWSGKHLYGNAFAMYAAVANFESTHDAATLELAKQTFRWLEAHGHDDLNGGYFEAYDQYGTPIIGKEDPVVAHSFVREPGLDEIGTVLGLKSMNSHIHMLEALTELHAVWPDPQVTRRLTEVFEIISTKVVDQAGYQHMFFHPDWKVASTEDSYGHDIETAYLLLEATAAIGAPNDPRTWHLARTIVDHTLAVAEDRVHGGFYDHGTPTEVGSEPFARTKVWWVQAEALNSLLIMHERYGKETNKYWEAFVRLWKFIQKYQIDPVHGGWYGYISEEGKPRPGAPKSDAWTEAYHQARAMANVTNRLTTLAKREDGK
jgi:cellobiose epimerase